MSTELEPGDILVAKTTANPLSRLIARLDGWWCHSAISLGGHEVAHSNAMGITRWSLDRLAEKYPQGLAVVRPALSADIRRDAAVWARDLTNAQTAYGAEDLGLSFLLLWRTRSQPSANELAELLLAERSQSGSAAQDIEYQATCSAFVYQCYLESSGTRLDVVTAPGIRRSSDDLLTVPNREELLEEARRLDPVHAQRQRLGAIGLNGLRSAWRASRSDTKVPLKVGVTPGDLWCSETADRWFVQGREAAITATANCRRRHSG